MREHNNLWCEMSAEMVIPDGQGNCSLCGAILHEPIAPEAIHLVDMFEDIALNRTKAESWEASDWLFDDEADALAIAKKALLSSCR
jgi:hypothetical protein